MGVTTATIWVCTRCGAVSHVDGGAQPSWVTHGFCSTGYSHTGGAEKHSLKPVLVVIPYA